MTFISLSFGIFFTIFFLAYWRVFNDDIRSQNGLLLAGSIYFYTWWDWQLVFLLLANAGLNYGLGMCIQRTENERHRTIFLWLGLIPGLGALFFYKYWPSISHHSILLPLGISYYTFRTISYLLDIKRRRSAATTDWLAFFCYVCFFPCLTAGPIDRARTLLPQLQTLRTFDYDQASDGMRQMLWGLFKKAVVADNCASFTGYIFDNCGSMPGSMLLIGALLYPIQLYADFSGYSDMAIGLSSTLGLRVTRNFNYPLFAENIVEYWRRWHISLTSWLTDYVFTPLSVAFRNYGKTGLIAAVLINFTAIGLWHGAKWTFVAHGVLNGCFFIPVILRAAASKRKRAGIARGSIGWRFFNRIGTFLLIACPLIFFRSDNLRQAFVFWHGLFSKTLFSMPVIEPIMGTPIPLLFIPMLLAAEWLQRDKTHALQISFIRPFVARALIYLLLLITVLGFSADKNSDFIYFKF